MHQASSSVNKFEYRASREYVTVIYKIVLYGLAGLWLLDGLLQFQPSMFSHSLNGFLANVLQYNTMGPPNLLTNFIHFAVVLTYGTQLRTDIFNSLAGALQILLGVTLFSKRWRNKALLISALWSVVPWVVGEGFGQMPWPQASMAFSGAPGAALIYGIISLGLLFYKAPDNENGSTVLTVGGLGFLGDKILSFLWCIIWCGTAILEFEPGNWANDAVSAQLKNSASDEPFLIKQLDLFLAHLAINKGTYIAICMIAVQVWIGFSVLRPVTRRASLVLGVILSFIYWVCGQNFGGLFTGSATDPQLGAPMILFALLLYPVGDLVSLQVKNSHTTGVEKLAA